MTIEEATELMHMKLKEYPAKDVADSAGTSTSTVYAWRRRVPRRPSLEVFVRFAVYFDLNLTVRELRRLV